MTLQQLFDLCRLEVHPNWTTEQDHWEWALAKKLHHPNIAELDRAFGASSGKPEDHSIVTCPVLFVMADPAASTASSKTSPTTKLPPSSKATPSRPPPTPMSP